MTLSIWSFTPIIAAPAAALVLVALLRWLLRLPANSTAAADKERPTDLASTDHSLDEAAEWDAITSHWNPFVTRVLPALVGAAIIFLVAWPFAYIGWAFMHTVGDPEIARLSPPWFGNVGYLLGFGVIGSMGSLAIAVIVGLMLTALYVIGQCVIWPAVCGCRPDEELDSDPQ